MSQSSSSPSFPLALPYRLFFLTIEPISTLVGAYYAHYLPSIYLTLTDPSSPAAASLPLSTTTALSQLANLYVLFAINEALVLRSTGDLNVWRTLLVGLLIADFGHLWSCRGLGGEIYWNILSWNKMAWGNIGFVYLGATMRICFLLGIGIGSTSPTGKGDRQEERGILSELERKAAAHQGKGKRG